MISFYYYRGTFLHNVLSASQSNVLFVLNNCTFRFADHINGQLRVPLPLIISLCMAYLRGLRPLEDLRLSGLF